MMSKVASMSPESVERISNSLGNMARERKLSTGSSTRLEKLFGFTSSSHLPLGEGDLNDLKEEDVWGDDSLFWESLSVKRERVDIFDFSRTLNNHRRWPGSERDSGFSAAFEGGKAGGLSSFSTINRGSGHRPAWNPGAGSFSTRVPSREGTSNRLTSATRMISNTGGGSDYFQHGIHQSAPVNVPNWTKVSTVGQSASFLVDDKEDTGEERLPPHELLARQYARSQITTFSVIEGAGRTLKGRDLSQVRNAVWKQTGFYG